VDRPLELIPVRIRVLGSCAGGGLPQWNCGGAYSVRARAGDADVPGLPPFLRDVATPDRETTVGVRITDRSSGRRLAFVPGLKSIDSATRAELEAADCRIVDGTFFSADELRERRPGAPDAQAMGHLPITGPESSLATLAEMPGRTLYIHMNNTNPVLDAGSPETARVRRAGVEIAADGQELEL
jgi:pyrroloquinoline quinone biosynthesis protein B